MAPLASLALLSVLSGVGVLLVFRHSSDQVAIRRTKALVTAHLLEFHLFMDEPRLVLRAQRDLIVANVRFIRLMIAPVLVLALPMTLLMAVMDAVYGHAPLPIGEPAIVTLHLKQGSASPVLHAPDGIKVETPSVHVPAQHEVSWRIRPARAQTGELRFVLPDRALAKSISAGAGLHFLSERRASITGLLINPTEPPIVDGEIDWIEVRYPSAIILHFHWLVWFFVISGATALALRRRFRTAF
jgi:hypothetical protein